MIMKRLGLKHVYHDAILRRVRFEGRRVIFEAALDGHWNHQCPQDALLAFETVQLGVIFDGGSSGIAHVRFTGATTLLPGPRKLRQRFLSRQPNIFTPDANNGGGGASRLAA